jgi:hypothetical protein
MTEPVAFEVRLREGLVRIDAQPSGGQGAETLPALRRSVEHTLRRLAGTAPEAPAFRFQVNGGRGILFHGALALPLEPARLGRLLGTVEISLESGESLDVDGELAGWVIQPEITLTDTQLRHAEDTLRGMRTVRERERDHSAFQTADTLKIRLRSRLTQLVSALQAAQRGPDKPA